MLNHSLTDPVCIPASFVCEEGRYTVTDALTDEDILTAAKSIMSKRFTVKNVLNSAKLSREFFITRLSELECEVFCVAFLNIHCQLLACEQMFRGSVHKATIYPREIVKRALVLNAAQVIFAHNHPSGSIKPSGNDRKNHAGTPRCISVDRCQSSRPFHCRRYAGIEFFGTRATLISFFFACSMQFYFCETVESIFQPPHGENLFSLGRMAFSPWIF